MSTHANLSPSKRHRWGLCPGSIREEAKYPEDRSGPAAIDGTHTHTLLEFCLSEDVEPETLVSATMQDDDGKFLIDAERAQRVRIAVDYVKQRVAEQPGCKVIAEQRVNPNRLIARDDMSGTVDIQIHGTDVLEIVDYKDGMGAVQAEGNAQLELYAVGALADVGEPYPWKRVRMTIIQPKMALRGQPAITSHEVDISEILAIVDRLVIEGAAVDAPDAPLVPGESQCKFCKAKGSCAALASNVMKEIGIMFQPTVMSLDVAQQSADKDPSTMDDGQILSIMEAAPLMRQLLEGVEKEALRRLQSGQAITGLKLVNGRGSRAWALQDDEIAEKLIKMGIPKGSVYETKLVSPAKAEKLTWEKRDGTKVQLTERQLKRMEQEYVVKMAGKLAVATESDSRPAVVMNAAPLFSAVEAAPVADTLPSWLL
jgi:hypothetical protein